MLKFLIKIKQFLQRIFVKKKCFYSKIDKNLLPAFIRNSEDFPWVKDIEKWFIAYILCNVTDNDVTKTNTWQSFISGDEIAWNGINYIILRTNNNIFFKTLW